MRENNPRRSLDRVVGVRPGGRANQVSATRDAEQRRAGSEPPGILRASVDVRGDRAHGTLVRILGVLACLQVCAWHRGRGSIFRGTIATLARASAHRSIFAFHFRPIILLLPPFFPPSEKRNGDIRSSARWSISLRRDSGEKER